MIRYFRLFTKSWVFCARVVKRRLCVKVWNVILRSDEWSHSPIIKWSTCDPTFILANILQTAACRGISSHPLLLFLPPPPVYSRPRAPLFSVFTPRSFGGCIDNTPLFFCSFLSHSYSAQEDLITSVLMSRRESRLTKWSYQTNSVGTNSWFWQRRFCHLH